MRPRKVLKCQVIDFYRADWRSLPVLLGQADRSEVERVTETQIATPKARTRSINNQRVIVENGIKHLPSFAAVGVPHKG